jgi:hypothetical protein
VRFDAVPHRGHVVITANPLMPVRPRRGAPGPLLAFSPASGRISYRLPGSGDFRVDLLAPDGRHGLTLARGSRPPGDYALALDPRRHGLGPGVYFLRAEQGGTVGTLRILLAP